MEVCRARVRHKITRYLDSSTIDCILFGTRRLCQLQSHLEQLDDTGIGGYRHGHRQWDEPSDSHHHHERWFLAQT